MSLIKYLLTIFLLFCSFLVHSQRFQNWKNLTHDNVENYILSSRYEFTNEYDEGVLKYYEGSKKNSRDHIEELAIVFKNQIVVGLIYNSIRYSEFNKIEGLDLDFHKELFKSVVSDFKKVIRNEGGIKIITDNDYKFETDFKKTYDGKVKFSYVGEKINGNRQKITFTDYYVLDERNYEIGGIDITSIDTYSLEEMVRFFLRDLYFFSQNYDKSYYNLPSQSFYEDEINIKFESLEGNTIALAYGMNIKKKIIIKVDPSNWKYSSLPERWYVLYHELGHDKLNFSHGQGGKMMFNFVDKDYIWKEFFDDRKSMFKYFFKKLSKF